MTKIPSPDKGSADIPKVGAVGVALMVIAVVIGGAAIYWLADLLTPLALAIFLMMMIESFTRFLKSRFNFLPGWAALATALSMLVTGFLLSAWVIAEHGIGFVDQLKGYAPRLNTLIAGLSSRFTQNPPPTVDELLNRLDLVHYLGLAANGFRGFLATTGFVLIYLGFLIAARAGFHRKWVRLFPGHEERARALAIFERMRFGIERYLWTQTVAGLMIACAGWAVMTIVGLDNAFFWAFVIFVLGYIPVIGPLAGAAAPPIFALGQFDSYVPALVLLGALNAIHLTVGALILPRLQGKSLNLDPVVVLLSLAFWGKIWGLAGMFLATPLTVAVIVVLAQFEGSHWIASLLSGDGDPLNQTKSHRKSLPGSDHA